MLTMTSANAGVLCAKFNAIATLRTETAPIILFIAPTPTTSLHDGIPNTTRRLSDRHRAAQNFKYKSLKCLSVYNLSRKIKVPKRRSP